MSSITIPIKDTYDLENKKDKGAWFSLKKDFNGDKNSSSVFKSSPAAYIIQESDQYIYVGSTGKSVEERINRHIDKVMEPDSPRFAKQTMNWKNYAKKIGSDRPEELLKKWKITIIPTDNKNSAENLEYAILFTLYKKKAYIPQCNDEFVEPCSLSWNDAELLIDQK